MLSMFEWSNDYSVGIGSIDAQHQNLFRIVGELFAAMSAGQGKAVLARTLDRLIQYTASHFAHEERLMGLHGYPDLAAHKAEHDALTKKVLQFQTDYQSGHAALTTRLFLFLKDWLVIHIQGTDRKYAPYLIRKAVA